MNGMLLFVLEILKFGVLYWLFYNKKVKRVWCAVVIGIIYTVLFEVLYTDFDIFGKHALGYACAWLTLFFMLQEKMRKRWVPFLILIFISLSLEQVLSVPLRIVDLFIDSGGLLQASKSIILSLLVLTTVVIAAIWKKISKNLKMSEMNSRTIYLLIVFMVVGMLATVSCVDYAEKYVSSMRFSIFTIVLCAISYVSIGMLGIFVIHIQDVNKKMDAMLQNEIVLKDMQKSYYEALLKKEEETRRYRHDMAGHFLCLENFVKERKIEELEDYLGKMQQQMRQIQGRSYVTGNQVIDVITNHYLSYLSAETEVHVSGTVNDALGIDNVSLCTIYTNLLKNAIEELERIKDAKSFLKIDFSQGVHFFCVEIQNSLSERSMRKTNVLHSEKEDRRNHGIGMKNVENVVKEYGGELNTRCNENVFIARVILKTTV